MTVLKTAHPGFGGEMYDPLKLYEDSTPLAPNGAYFAGLLDGEGCFGIYTRSDNYHAGYRGEIAVGMTNPEPLEALRRRYGGLISHMSRQREGWARRYSWKITDPTAIIHVLKDVGPHLIVKRVQARILFEFCTLRLSKPRTAKVSDDMNDAFKQLRQQISDLNTKGKDYVVA